MKANGYFGGLVTLGVLLLGVVLAAGCSKNGPSATESGVDTGTEKPSEPVTSSTAPNEAPRPTGPNDSPAPAAPNDPPAPAGGGDLPEVLEAARARAEGHCQLQRAHENDALFLASSAEKLSSFDGVIASHIDGLTELVGKGGTVETEQRTYSATDLKELLGRAREKHTDYESQVGQFEKQASARRRTAMGVGEDCERGRGLVGEAEKRISEVRSKEGLMDLLRSPEDSNVDDTSRKEFLRSMNDAMESARASQRESLKAVEQIPELPEQAPMDREPFEQTVVEAGRLAAELEAVVASGTQ